MSFTNILNLSISASWLVLILALLRPLLKGHGLRCALWSLLAVRLLCPISIESELSLLPTREVIPREYLVLEPREPAFQEPAQLELITNPIYEDRLTVQIEPTVDRVQQWDLIASVLWVAGMTAMVIYAAYSYLSLRIRIRMAGWVGGTVWECDDLASPFILGLLRPRIYLPAELDPLAKEHVLAHERAHIARFDHLWKPLGFFLLSIHWFNPVLWLAYVLLCRDIELACDERVVRSLEKHEIVAYSSALVRCAVSHRSIAMCPLAFGEVGVKNRVKAILHYRKPGFWVVLTAVIIAVLLTVGFLTDPAVESVPAETIPEHRSIDAVLNEEGLSVTETVRRNLDLMFYIDWLPEACFSPQGHTFQEGELTLYESDTTFLDLIRVAPVDDQLRFDFRFRYHVPESGTVLLPCHITIKGISYGMRLTGSFHDFSRDYEKPVLLQDRDTLEFSLLIHQDVVASAEDYLSIGLGDLYETTYVPDGLTILDKELLAEKAIYQDSGHTLTGSAAYAATYIVGPDLHLTAVEQCPHWEIRWDMGALTHIQLTEDNFDALFLGGYSANKLRKSNARAWLCQGQELSHYLLLQTDGSVYLAVLRDHEALVSDLYQLKIGAYAPRAPEVRQRTYSLTGMDVFDRPGFTLFTDGTFKMTTSIASSYFGFGHYLLEKDRLVMKTADGMYTWVFTPEATGVRFDAAHSSPIAFLKTPRDFVTLPDGAIFGSHSPYTQSKTTLEEAINQSILKHNRAEEDDGLICVENHEVLGELVACGAATVDGSPTEIITVYLAGEYRTYKENLVHQRFERFCAAVTLKQGENGYAITDYHQTGNKKNEAETIFPAHILELYDQRFSIIREWTTRENRFDAQLILSHTQGLETNIETLLDLICSSPAQSSNPGAYIAAHQEEFDRLVALGTHTIRHCFAAFARGDQIGLKGHVMALACQEIIPGETHDLKDECCMTGQDWFNHFSSLAQRHQSETRPLDFERKHPFCFLALQALGS